MKNILNIFKEKKMKNLIYPRQNGKLLMALFMALLLFSCRSQKEPDDPPDPPDLVCKAESNANCQEIFLTNAGIGCPDSLARVSERCTGERLATCDNGAGIRWDYFGYDAFQLDSEQQTCESMGHTWAPQSDPPVSFGVNVTTPDMSVTTESGRSVMFTLVLTGQPTANVVITPTSSDPGEGRVSPETLTFTSDNWADAQTVTITGENDNIADGSQSYQITFTVSSTDTNYNNFSLDPVDVTNTDNNTPGITLSLADSTTSESDDDNTGTINVVLNTQPTADVTITPTSSDDGEGTVSGALTFTSDNWNDAQTVTVTGVNDDIDDENQSYQITFMVSSEDANYRNFSLTPATMTNSDNDMAGITLTPTDSTTSESGDTGTIRVVLTTEPTADVVITPASSRTTEGTVSGALTFTSGNWNMPQDVTVTGANDNIDDGDQSYQITFTVVSDDTNYNNLRVRSVDITNTDNDTATFMVTGPGTVGEGDGTATYTVSLSAEPAQDVTVDYAITGTATLDSDYMLPAPSASLTTASSGTLSFTTTSWDMDQSITLTIVDDTVDDDGETIIFTLSDPDPSNRASLSGIPSVTTTIVDNDDPEVMASFGATTYSVTEGGSRNVTVTLSADPERQVVIPLTATNGAGAEASDYSVPTSVTFMDDETSKTVTFTSTSDDVDESNETVTLAFGTLPTRVTAGSTASTTVTITDDDTRGVTVSETALTVPEGGMATYTVVLDSQPTGNVTVMVGGASGDVLVDTDSTMTRNQHNLTFTPSNWNTAQTVTVTAAEDNDKVSDAAVTLTHTVSGADYASVAAANVTVTITENDTRGVTVSETALTVTEGMTGTYTVVLGSEPTGNVTVTVGGVSGDVSVSPSSLTFTSSNWDDAQTVTVTAGQDTDITADAVVTLTHTVSGADYASETAGSVTVTIVEDDKPTFSVTGPARVGEGNPDPLAVRQDGTATYTVSLSAEPDSNVTVKYATADDTATAVSDYTASSGTLTFTTTNWNTPQTVDVTIIYDDDDSANDAADETFTFTLSDPADGAALSASPSVTTTITDWPNVTVSFAGTGTTVDYTVAEGTTLSAVVNLDRDPRRTVSVTLSRGHSAGIDENSGDYTVTASPFMPLIFMSGETSQTITFTAIADGIARERRERVQLGLTSTTGVTRGEPYFLQFYIPAN